MISPIIPNEICHFSEAHSATVSNVSYCNYQGKHRKCQWTTLQTLLFVFVPHDEALLFLFPDIGAGLSSEHNNSHGPPPFHAVAHSYSLDRELLRAEKL